MKLPMSCLVCGSPCRMFACDRCYRVFDRHEHEGGPAAARRLMVDVRRRKRAKYRPKRGRRHRIR